jgi:hypothetical protein
MNFEKLMFSLELLSLYIRLDYSVKRRNAFASMFSALA